MSDYKERKRDYIRKYNQGHYRSVNILFRNDDPEHQAIWDWLHTKYSTAGYVKDLIVKAYRAEKKED